MPKFLKTTEIACVDDKSNAKVLAALKEVADDVACNAPETEQYIIGLPLEDNSRSKVYIIEEFVTKKAFESHQSSQAVLALDSLLRDHNIVAGDPEVHVGPVSIRATSGRPLPLTSNPAILLVGMEYKPGTLSNALQGWKAMAEGAVDSVPGVNVFTVMEDAETSNIRTVEVLDSWESLSVLVQTDAAKRNIEHNGKDRTGHKTAIKLQAVAGFIGRA